MNNMVEKLEEILRTKEAIKTAIENKGQHVGDVPLADYASKIDNISSSGDMSLYALIEDVGKNEDLATADKETLVGAINELKAMLDDIGTVTDPVGIVEALNDKADKETIGDLANLETMYKESIVDAINELHLMLINNEGALDDKVNQEDFDSELSTIQQAIVMIAQETGNLAELTTTQKNNLVAAINEVNAQIGDVDLSEVFTLLEGKVSQEDFDTAVNVLQSNIDNIELTPGPQGPPGADGQPGQPGADGVDGYTPIKGVDYFDGQDGQDGKSAYQIWLDKGNTGTEQDFLDSLEGPQGPPGEPDQDLVRVVQNNKNNIDRLLGKSSDWSYFFANQDLEAIDFSNMSADLPGSFYRDNYIQGISYDMYGMFSGATFPTPPPGDPYEWEWDPNIPDSNFWKWFMNYELWMNITPSSFENMFANAKGDVIMLPSELRIEIPISAEGMFSGVKVNKIDLGYGFGYGINDMSRMFADVSNPDGGPTKVDLSRLVTVGVKDMSYMFWMSNIATLDLSSFDTSNVTNMNHMFNSSKATTLDVSSFDTSNITDMDSMFSFSRATTLDLRSFDTSNVTSMNRMFNGSKATTLDVSSFDTSNVTDMTLMFGNTQATTLDLSSFDTSKVTNMNSMFINSKATIGYARTQADANRFNASSGKPSKLKFVVHPDLV